MTSAAAPSPVPCFCVWRTDLLGRTWRHAKTGPGPTFGSRSWTSVGKDTAVTLNYIPWEAGYGCEEARKKSLAIEKQDAAGITRSAGSRDPSLAGQRRASLSRQVPQDSGPGIIDQAVIDTSDHLGRCKWSHRQDTPSQKGQANAR